jgi:hypothetical protein
MLSPIQIILGFLLPAVLVGLVVLGCRIFPSGAMRLVVRSLLAPVVVLGFCIAFLEFEPRLAGKIGSNVIDWLFYVPIMFGFLGLLDDLFRPPLWLRTIVLLILWHMISRLMLLPQIPSSVSETTAALWVDATTLVTLVWFLAIEHVADRVAGFAVPAILAVLSGGAAILLAMAWHIQSSGELAGALAVMCFGALAASIFGGKVFFRGFGGTIALLIQLLILHGYFYTNDTLTTAQQTWAAIYLASPVLIFLGDLPGMQRLRPSWRLAVRIVPLAVLVAIIAGIAVRDFVRSDQMRGQEQGID